MSKVSATGQNPMVIPLTGGLDLVTPPVAIPPGRCIAAVNYEPIAQGYARNDGVERLDGHPAPSEADYSTLNFGTGTANITQGETVTGATSGATGMMLADAVVSSGSFADGNAAGYLALGAITGTFQANEALQVSAVTVATATAVAEDRGAPDDTTDATYMAQAVVNARNLIQPVPGGGPVRGAAYCRVDGNYYAFRDNAASGATKCPMWRATPTGWQSVPLGWMLQGTTGSGAAIVAGNTVTGATSGATGVVSRVLTDGEQDWANGLALRLVLSATTGTFKAGENLTVGGTVLATAAGAQTDNTPLNGGRFECINSNFYGETSQGALYGVTGVSPAWEFDGTIFTPVLTGAPVETPHHIAEHRLHLWLAYPNGQLQGSQSGVPQGWNGTLGAFADGLGDTIAGLLSNVAGNLAIYCLSSIYILTGETTSDFAINPLVKEVGALEWTVQNANNPTYCDQGGVRNMTTTLATGGFNIGTLTQLIQPWMLAKKTAGVQPVASLSVRAKTHYRLYYADGTGFTIFVGAKAPSILPFDYGARIPRCTFSCVDEDGSNEILLMGCDDGYVYQIDKGTSLDGDTIDGFLRPAFNHCGSPNNNKRFHRLSLQVSATVASLFMTAAFSDGDPDMPSVDEQSFSVYGGGAFWDETGANWDQFNWSSRVIGRADAFIDGLGTNFSPTIGCSSAVENSHTISSMTLLFSMRGPLS